MFETGINQNQNGERDRSSCRQCECLRSFPWELILAVCSNCMKTHPCRWNERTISGGGGGENSRAPMIFSRLFQVGSPQCTEAACTICVRPTSSCQCDATQACVAEIQALSRRVRERRVVVVCSVQHFNIFHYQCLQCSHSFHYKYIVCAT